MDNDSKSLGMPTPEYNWSAKIRSFKTCSGVTLNGFISTTALSSMQPFVIAEPKFELMLNVPRLSDYLLCSKGLRRQSRVRAQGATSLWQSRIGKAVSLDPFRVFACPGAAQEEVRRLGD